MPGGGGSGSQDIVNKHDIFAIQAFFVLERPFKIIQPFLPVQFRLGPVAADALSALFKSGIWAPEISAL